MDSLQMASHVIDYLNIIGSLALEMQFKDTREQGILILISKKDISYFLIHRKLCSKCLL